MTDDRQAYTAEDAQKNTVCKGRGKPGIATRAQEKRNQGGGGSGL